MELSNEWKGDETFSKLFSAVTEIHSKIVATMEQVNASATYEDLFEEEVKKIYHKYGYDFYEWAYKVISEEK